LVICACSAVSLIICWMRRGEYRDARFVSKRYPTVRWPKWVAQFLALCSRSKWSKHFTHSPFLALPAMHGGSVTKRFLCIPVQSTYECKTRGEERWHCPPRGEADAHNSQSLPRQDALPCAFEAVLDSNLFVTLPACNGPAPVRSAGDQPPTLRAVPVTIMAPRGDRFHAAKRVGVLHAHEQGEQGDAGGYAAAGIS
jgi:hypothetical protein